MIPFVFSASALPFLVNPGTKEQQKVARGEPTKRQKTSSCLFLIGGVGRQAGAINKEGIKRLPANSRLQDGSTKKVARRINKKVTRKRTHQVNEKRVLSQTKPLSETSQTGTRKMPNSPYCWDENVITRWGLRSI